MTALSPESIGFLTRLDDTLERWVDFAARHRFPAIELLVSGGTHGPDADRIAAIRATLAGQSVGVSAIGLWHVNPLAANPDERERNLATIGRYLDLATEVRSPVLYLNAGQTGPDERQNAAAFANVFPTLIARARERGVQIAVYLGHPGNWISSIARLDTAISAVPEIGLKIDPVGVIRNLKADPLAVLDQYGARLAHFHAKDLLRLGRGEVEPPVGMGEMPWGQIMSLLYLHNYGGAISIEPHGPEWDNPESRGRYIVLSRRHLAQFTVRPDEVA